MFASRLGVGSKNLSAMGLKSGSKTKNLVPLIFPSLVIPPKVHDYWWAGTGACVIVQCMTECTAILADYVKFPVCTEHTHLLVVALPEGDVPGNLSLHCKVPEEVTVHN